MQTLYINGAFPHALLKGELGPGFDGNPSEPEKASETIVGEDDRALLCRMCRSKITRRDLGMVVNGKQQHVFFNPLGEIFELGCFASAKNVVPVGIETDEFTWFPGYAWQVVGCTGCSTQLGWRYTGNDGGFFGLILNALVEEDTGRP